MGKYVFEKQFDGDDQKNAVLVHLIHCHDPGRTFHGNQIYTVVLSLSIMTVGFYHTMEWSSPCIMCNGVAMIR